MRSQTVFLNSSLNGQQTVLRGENITFNCLTVGSSILAWTSDEYIADRIEFLVVNSNGTVMTQNPHALARLMAVYIDESGQAVLVSQLNITVQSNILRFSVSCLNVGNGEFATANFSLSSKFLYYFMQVIIIVQ